MKKLILLSMLLAAWAGTARIWAEVDPGDRFLDAYLQVQDGDTAERETDWVKANAKYNAALDILHEIKTNSPDWNPNIVEFRTKYCTDHLNALKIKLTAPAPGQEAPAPAPTSTPVSAAAPVPAVAPVAPAAAPMPVITTLPVAAPKPAPAEVGTAPSVDTEHIQQLTTELQRAQDKIRELEIARTDLKAKLDEAIAKPAPVVPGPVPAVPVPDTHVADLTKQNQELSAQLAAAQAQAADLKEQLKVAAKPEATVVPVAPATPVESPELTQLKAELQRSQEKTSQLEAAQAALATKLQEAQAKPAPVTPDPRVTELANQNKELNDQLAASQAQVTDLKDKLQVAMKPVPPVESAELKQLKADLKLAQDKTSQLEGAHALLAAKLKEAQTMIATPDTRIVGLTKQNQELSTQLATAQAQTAKLQEQLKVASKPAVPVVPVESPELKQLRTELQRAKDEQAASHNKLDSLLNEKSALDQRYQSVSAKLATAEQKLRTAKPGTERDELVVVKKQLEQSQQRLTVAQEAVEAARAEAKRSQRAAADATAKLSETERQLRAARTASAKNEEIIEQLRKDNANLKRERGQNFVAGPVEEEYTGPTIPELKGWRPHNWPPKAAKPKPATPTKPAATASKQGKVTATIPAPPKPAPNKNTVAPVPAKPVKPAPAQGSGWWPFGKPAAPVTNQPPAVKAPVKAATD